MIYTPYKDLNQFGKAEIEELLTLREGPCVSFFLPTSPVGGHGTQVEPFMLRSLLYQATVQLAAQGMSTVAIEELLAPVVEIAAPNKEFWRQQRNGLAFFVSPHFCMAYRLPLVLPELVVVDQHFYLRPLLPIIDGHEYFYLLALSQNAVRLFQGERYQMAEIELTDTPTSLAETLRYDELERSLQLHPAGSSPQGQPSVIFHGHGVSGDEAIVRANLSRFFQAVERAVTSCLARTHAPLLLAGVDMDQGIYRQVNHYPHLFEQGIPGNPDKLSPATLQKLAWALVAPYFEGECSRALARYRQLAGRGDGHTVTEIKNVVLATVYHQVDTLFITPTRQIWGRFIPEGHQVVVHKTAEPGDEELVNLAVIHTLRNNGRAYLVEPGQMPEATTVAAILRY